LNAFTGSQISKDLTLSIVTSSIDVHILKQATQTGSQDLVNLGISTYTGSQNVINSSVDAHILKQATQTGSQDLVNLGISRFTGSLRREINSIEAYTASLKGAIEVSGQNVNVLGMITAQQFNVTYVSSSVMYQSGSNKFGNSSDDIHEFTGSIVINGGITGSLQATNGVVSASNQIPELFRLMQSTASLNTYTGSSIGIDNGLMAYTSSLKSAFSVSGTTTTHNGPVDLGGNTVYSNWGTPANVNNGATTTFTYNQASGEFQVQFQYNIIGLYAPSGTNLNGYASGIVHFMADGTTNNAAVSSIGSSGWTVTASATNGGAFTITFTNSGGATMSNVNYRITKLNRTGLG
jgi:hypothetical protein